MLHQPYSSVYSNPLFLDTRLQDESILAYTHIFSMQVVQHIKVQDVTISTPFQCYT